MSTEYIASIQYDDFVNRIILTLEEPKEPFLVDTHKIIHEYGSYIHVTKDREGNLILIRYGKNSIWEIFQQIVDQFGCKIVDEYPDCMD